MNAYPTIYKLDSKEKIRIWRMEVELGRFRTIAGLQDGKQVISAWTDATPKNVGKANETSPEEQAILEVEANYKKKLKGEYHDNILTIGIKKFFQPMLGDTVKWCDRKDKIVYGGPLRYFAQPKLDGVRCIVTRFGAWTRTGEPLLVIPHILEALQPAFDINPDARFDGELYNHDFKDDFEEILSIVKKVKVKPEHIAKARDLIQLHVYDYPTNLEDDFIDRYEDMVDMLETASIISTATPGPIRLVETHEFKSEQEFDDLYEIFIDAGYEGGMGRINKSYDQKRSKYLIKRKDFDDGEFIIIRIEEGKGNWAGCAARIIFQNDQGECGETGAGVKGNRAYRRKVFEEREEYIGKEATIRYFGRTVNLKPRIPVAQALHKTPRI